MLTPVRSSARYVIEIEEENGWWIVEECEDRSHAVLTCDYRTHVVQQNHRVVEDSTRVIHQSPYGCLELEDHCQDRLMQYVHL